MNDPKDFSGSISILHLEIGKLFYDLLYRKKYAVGSEFPPVDILETGDSMRVEIELPGLEMDDIKIEVWKEALLIEGIKKDPESSKRVSYVCMERCFGFFRRLIALPEAGDTSNIKVMHENGIFIISIPKLPTKKAGVRKIEIE